MHHWPRPLRSPPDHHPAPRGHPAEVRRGIVHLRRIDLAGCRLLRVLRRHQGEQVHADDC